MAQECEAFLVRAISDHKTKDKRLLSFKKDQKITVEQVDYDKDRYFGFYGKKEGWFDKFYVVNTDGAPETRKNKKSKQKEEKKSSAPAVSDSKSSEESVPKSSKVSKKDLRAAKKKEKEEAEAARKKEKEAKKTNRKSVATKKTKKGGDAKQESKDGKESFPTDQGKQIPAIVENTISYLEQPDCLKLEGLFRISGSINDVKSIKESFLKGKPVDLSKVNDPHTIAGVLKIFFRESPDPLLTFELYDCWIEAIANPHVDRVAKIRQVVNLLPTANRLILGRLMGLLTKVAAQSSVNRMTVQNIAIVFAPTLLRPKDNQLHIVIQDSSHANELIKFMIENYDNIFLKVDPMDAMVNLGSATITGALTGATSDKQPEETDDQFEKRMKRGSLLLARGSIIGGHNTFQELTHAEDSEDDDDEREANVDVSYNDISSSGAASSSGQSDEGSESESLSSTEESEDDDDDDDSSFAGQPKMTLVEMMDKILDGQVNEVDAYLATLDPDYAANVKKELLERIDKLMQSEEFNC